MKRQILILTLLTLLTFCFQAVSAQTIFGFETASDNGATITETINDITVTLSGDPDLELLPSNGFGNSTGNIVLTQNTITSITFTFDQPVMVNSIIPMEVFANTADYTFTPIGGANVPVTVSLIGGEIPTISLNWINVTSFTVTAASGAAFGFDELSVDTGTNGQTFFEWETANNEGGTITETVNGIEVKVAGDSSYALTDYGSTSGTSGNVILSNANRTAITFTFDDPVLVNSILALEGTGANIDYTFTPTGGNNSPVIASLVSGAAAVPLNWINVSSFTVTSSGGQFGFDNLSVTGIESTTIFDFDTNTTWYEIDEPSCEFAFPWFNAPIKSYVDETIDDLTITVTSDPYCAAVVLESGAINGMNANRTGGREFPLIVTFSQSVALNSMLVNDDAGNDFNRTVDFTITPIGGNNSPVTVPVILGAIVPVQLNWVNVTGFRITPSIISNINIDNVSVNAYIPLSVSDNQSVSQVTVYPNPVDNMLYVKNSSSIELVTLYSLLGQEVLQSKEVEIDVSLLSNGMYLLEIETSEGVETRRIVKK